MVGAGGQRRCDEEGQMSSSRMEVKDASCTYKNGLSMACR